MAAVKLAKTWFVQKEDYLKQVSVTSDGGILILSERGDILVDYDAETREIEISKDIYQREAV